MKNTYGSICHPSRQRRPWGSSLGVLAVLVGALALSAGCLSTNPGSASLAYVEILGVPIEQVHAAALRVFRSESYQVESSSENECVFVREGTQRDRVQYGRYGQSLQMRVVVTLEDEGRNGVFVRADAYAVSGGSDVGATKLLRMARRPYVQLLERVKQAALAPGLEVE